MRVAVIDEGEWRREFIVHGKQTLLELRAKLGCATTKELEYQACGGMGGASALGGSVGGGGSVPGRGNVAP